MFNIGPGELLAICAVALIVLGPDRLPQALRTVGRVIGELRRISGGFQDELRRAVDDAESAEVERSIRPVPPAELTGVPGAGNGTGADGSDPEDEDAMVDGRDDSPVDDEPADDEPAGDEPAGDDPAVEAASDPEADGPADGRAAS
jgi:sec-independent protein translocase protein TatB